MNIQDLSTGEFCIHNFIFNFLAHKFDTFIKVHSHIWCI